MPGAGQFRDRIKIERATSTTNSLNEPIRTWSELITLWARRRDVSDGEAVAAGQLAAHGMTRFLVDHFSVTASVTADDRIIYGGQTWNIRGVKRADIGHLEYIEITAEREAN